MALKLSNNAVGLLALAISDSDTSLTLRAGHGSRFPALSAGYYFPITVVRASDPSQLEIMRCIGRSGDTLTVERAQEGTSALAFDPGDVVELRLTAGTLEENFPQRSDLGTAATRDVTTSPTDTTEGRVLTVGSLGLGGGAAPVPGNNIDDNTIPTGFYFVTPATSGTKPPGDDGYGHLIVSREGHGITARQLYLDNVSDRIWTRVWSPSQWSTWQLALPTGVGQTWQDVASSRSRNTTYTNTTGRPIAVAITASGSQGFTFIVDGVDVSYLVPNWGQFLTMFAIVPPGSTYRLNTNNNVERWAELR